MELEFRVPESLETLNGCDGLPVHRSSVLRQIRVLRESRLVRHARLDSPLQPQASCLHT